MLLNIIKRSFVNQKKAMAVMVVSVAVGTAIAASLIALSLDIETKVSRELRSFGANIVVQPKTTGLADIAGQKRYLREKDIVKTKTIFWRHNIIGVVPLLSVEDEKSDLSVLGTWYKHAIPVPGEEKGFETGVYNVMPWWSIDGKWPSSDNEILVGISLSQKLNKMTNDSIEVFGEKLVISGIVNTGGKEDDMLVGDLSRVQIKGVCERAHDSDGRVCL
jgi:putative ABC transport system permease protein